ncbi:hypothetical protein [Methylobacterium radiodurans]|uniref:Uncharacterized protein n=1 Tax=Methylobacterium radiodurans TaxID=2202828 RepID=A0A2U8VUD4_9HYPH|nr:hypothetical protein [Methylobacterium radiodurans]AWN37394.1 hypothetical protein DK427_18085 [Methylobacterium radiodurans]
MPVEDMPVEDEIRPYLAAIAERLRCPVESRDGRSVSLVMDERQGRLTPEQQERARKLMERYNATVPTATVSAELMDKMTSAVADPDAAPDGTRPAATRPAAGRPERD